MNKLGRAQYYLIFSVAVILAAAVLLLTGVTAMPNEIVSGRPLYSTLWCAVAITALVFVYVALRYDVAMALAAAVQYAHDVLLTLALLCVYSLFANVGAWFPAALMAASVISLFSAIYLVTKIKEQSRDALLRLRPRAEVAQLAVKAARPTFIRAAIIIAVFCAACYFLAPEVVRDSLKVVVVGGVVACYSGNAITGYVWSFVEEARLARKTAKNAKK